jgi:hypothetical protein
MARASTTLVDQLVTTMNSLEKTRSKMETLLSAGSIVRRDIEQVYSGLFMKGITSFEYLIEALFVGLLVKQFDPASAKIVKRVTLNSHLVARDVVFGGRNYVDWLPYQHTEKRAAAFFRAGKPFTQLSKPGKKTLENLLYIRNAIAHPSSYARGKFEQEVIGALPLTGVERSPAGFLRIPFRVMPYQTRYENAASEMVNLARKICT